MSNDLRELSYPAYHGLLAVEYQPEHEQIILQALVRDGDTLKPGDTWTLPTPGIASQEAQALALDFFVLRYQPRVTEHGSFLCLFALDIDRELLADAARVTVSYSPPKGDQQ